MQEAIIAISITNPYGKLETADKRAGVLRCSRVQNAAPGIK
jgi:hypothetical protein